MSRDRRRDGGESLGDIGDVGRHIAGLGADGREVGGDLLAMSGVASGEDQGGAFPGRGPRDAGPETLRAADDEDDLPLEEIPHRPPPPLEAPGEMVARSGCSHRGLATAVGRRPSRTSTTPAGAAVNGAAVARRLSPIRCGVRTTSGWSNSGWCCGGSGSNTSSPIPAIRPATSAWNAASLSMRDPRPQLMRIAPGFVRPIVSAL